MDLCWAITFAANCFLLCLLIKDCHYLNFLFLTFLVSFNVFTAPVMWFFYSFHPDIYSIAYYAKPWILYVLWFCVVIEAFAMRQKQIAIPVELYAFVKIFAVVAHHIGFVQAAYWINQSMRIVNIAIILVWIFMFYPKKELHHV